MNSFVHRVKMSHDSGKRVLTVEHFQFSRSEAERKIHALTLFHTFVIILDVFSDFLVTEQKAVSKEWQDELRGLGEAIERHAGALRETLPPDDAEGTG